MKLTSIPETDRAYLPSAGLGFSRATLHVYHHSEEYLGIGEKLPMLGTAHIYRCTETGAMRRWGFV